MRIAELLENSTTTGTLTPSEYMPIAQQRDAKHKQKMLATRQASRQKQQALQQQVWSKSRAVKPKKRRISRGRKSKPIPKK